jgi:hypothetical protein
LAEGQIIRIAKLAARCRPQTLTPRSKRAIEKYDIEPEHQARIAGAPDRDSALTANPKESRPPTKTKGRLQC